MERNQVRNRGFQENDNTAKFRSDSACDERRDAASLLKEMDAHLETKKEEGNDEEKEEDDDGENNRADRNDFEECELHATIRSWEIVISETSVKFAVIPCMQIVPFACHIIVVLFEDRSFT